MTPDFSASMHSVPPSLIAAHQESGMNRDLTDLAIEVWNSDTTMPQKFGRFADEAPAWAPPRPTWASSRCC